MTTDDYRSLSLWLDTVPGGLSPRPSLTADEAVDVAIVGAGYTGLWTAYYLKKLGPGTRVAIVEAEVAGFGASGRNGGWCMGSLAGLHSMLSRPDQRAGALALQRAMIDTVDEVGRVASDEGIDCHFAKGGQVQVATSRPHVDLLRREIAAQRALGYGDDDYRWLEPDDCARRVNTARNLGGTYTPHCAAIDPARLARGLADVVEGQGAAIYERSPALAIESGCVSTAGGRLRAEVVVRATEGYTANLPGYRRHLIPVHSMMIATAPLPPSLWPEIGLAERELFSDPRRLVIYGQRTADGRLAFGARGNYYFGSRVRDRFSADDPGFRQVQRTLLSLFPRLAGTEITHRWGGPLGVPRDWRPSVGFDRASGLAWAGGYVGEGVAASNLAGRTLADLILQRDSERARLPWVGHRSPRWEPEPLRWLGTAAVRRLGESADGVEEKTGRSPRLRAAAFRAFVRS
jgi:glycine/D-amino acid oxidase-like deaminating enzyme